MPRTVGPFAVSQLCIRALTNLSARAKDVLTTPSARSVVQRSSLCPQWNGDAMTAVSTAQATGTVDIMIPVYNEERALPGCVEVLHEFLGEQFPFDWSIVVVDNAST